MKPFEVKTEKDPITGKQVRYVDMAIYIDNRLKDYPEQPLTQEEEERIYRYLYYLCYMLGCKGRYLNKVEDYENFSLSAAGTYFIRLIDKRQFGDNPTLKPIKSILNYIKKTLYAICDDWRRENFAEILDKEYNRRLDPETVAANMRNSIQCRYYAQSEEYLKEDITNIPNHIRANIYNSQYKNDPLLCQQLYVACLLNVLNTLTLSNRDKINLQIRDDKCLLKDTYINRLYSRSQEEPLIMWHLDEKYKDYLQYLVNKSRYDFINSVYETNESFKLSEEVLQDILWSSYTPDNNSDVDDMEA